MSYSIINDSMENFKATEEEDTSSFRKPHVLKDLVGESFFRFFYFFFLFSVFSNFLSLSCNIGVRLNQFYNKSFFFFFFSRCFVYKEERGEIFIT
jgi:hypothetical protein